MFDELFAGIAIGFADQFGAPYSDAVAKWPGIPTYDDGGSIVTPGDPVEKPCKAQVSAPTEAMRAEAGFLQTDMRLHVLSATLDGSLDAEAVIVVAAGPHAGAWELQTAMLDTAGIGWTCRGRRA